MDDRRLDVICLGRSSIDLYGEQVGGRLEDMASFAKYVGGCPANIAIGAARLGLKSALITRVGDEHMGRFIRETLGREGVDTSHVKTDPKRLTALVILGIRDRERFPLIFFRTDCADMAIEESDFDLDFIASAKALVVTGTHFSAPGVERASRAAIAHAKRTGTKVVFDIDYRPVLWGLTGLGQGDERFVESARTTERLRSIVADCDLVVGTEEEFHIAGGSTDTRDALVRLRALGDAVLVVKRGPMGCVVFQGPIPASLEMGVVGRGFPVEVYNVIGAGDGFMAGFLRAWLRGETIETAAAWANACGAFVVSRHGCAPATPTWAELERFLAKGSPHRRLREDGHLNHLHWATTRRPASPEILALGVDGRRDLEPLAAAAGAPADRVGDFATLLGRAWRDAGADKPGFGIAFDDRYGEAALFDAAGRGLWIARSVDPFASDIAIRLREWPVEHIAASAVAPELDAAIEALLRLHAAARATSHEWLLAVEGQNLDDFIGRVYDAGLRPDWWLVAPEGEWSSPCRSIVARDPYVRGVLARNPAIETAAFEPLCKGFVAGPSLFADAARRWFEGEIDDAQAAAVVARNFRMLIERWREAHAASRDSPRRRERQR